MSDVFRLRGLSERFALVLGAQRRNLGCFGPHLGPFWGSGRQIGGWIAHRWGVASENRSLRGRSHRVRSFGGRSLRFQGLLVLPSQVCCRGAGRQLGQVMVPGPRREGPSFGGPRHNGSGESVGGVGGSPCTGGQSGLGPGCGALGIRANKGSGAGRSRAPAHAGGPSPAPGGPRCPSGGVGASAPTRVTIPRGVWGIPPHKKELSGLRAAVPNSGPAFEQTPAQVPAGAELRAARAVPRPRRAAPPPVWGCGGLRPHKSDDSPGGVGDTPPQKRAERPPGRGAELRTGIRANTGSGAGRSRAPGRAGGPSPAPGGPAARLGVWGPAPPQE